MNYENLSDKRSIYQVLGALLQRPALLDEVKLPLEKDDFPEPFHKIIFACINNLYAEGVVDIDYIAVDNFLSQYPKQYKVFSDNNGIEYLIDATENASILNFKYNYERVKKFSLLRNCYKEGIDMSDVYDEKIISPTKHEEMQEQFDKMSLQDIVETIDRRVLALKEKFLGNHGSYGQHAGKGLKELKEELKKEPEIGSPLCSWIFNTIFRGARLKKLYLRSAPTGVGRV